MARNEVERFFDTVRQRHLDEAATLLVQQAEFLSRGDLNSADKLDEVVQTEKGRIRFLNQFVPRILDDLRSQGIKILEVGETAQVGAPAPEKGILTPEAEITEVVPQTAQVEEEKIPETFITPDDVEFGGKTGKLLAFLAYEEGGWIPKRRDATTKYLYGVVNIKTEKALAALIAIIKRSDSTARKNGVIIESQIPPLELRTKGARAFDWLSLVAGPEVDAKEEVEVLDNGRNNIEPAVIARAQAGDHAAFEVIFNRYWNPVYKFVYRMMGNGEDAFDFTQDTFLKAYSALPRTSHDLKVRAWIYRIATNACLDELRRRKLIRWQPWESFISVFHPSQISRDNPERDVLDEENQKETQAILDRLHPKYRAALILRHYQDLSYDEIAEVLGTTRAAVKSIIFRGREEFRQVYAGTDRRPALPAA